MSTQLTNTHLINLLAMAYIILNACGTNTHIVTSDAYDEYDLDPVEDDAYNDAEHCREGFILVSEGDFLMGDDDGVDESPQHVVLQSTFCISEYETSNAEWKECVSVGACTEPHRLSSVTRDEYYEDSIFDNYPVIHVDWYQARNYCLWIDGNLPTESQWEKAARGGCEIRGSTTACEDYIDEPKYPWGDAEPDCELTNYCGFYPSRCCNGDTDGISSRISGQSCYGISNLSGNVSEWVRDWYSEDYYEAGGPTWNDPQGPTSGVYKVLRGGSWEQDIGILTTYSRVPYGPDQATEYIGFRCVVPPE